MADHSKLLFVFFQRPGEFLALFLPVFQLLNEASVRLGYG